MVDPVELGPEFFQAPLRSLDLLRGTGPAHPMVLPDGMRAWVVTDYAEAKRLLADDRLGKAREPRADVMAERSGRRPVAQDNVSISSHLLTTDPPDHTRLRTLVNRAFTARRVAQLRPQVQRLADRLLDALPVAAEVDLLDRFAFPLTMGVIGDLLGVPPDEQQRFHDVVHPLFAADQTQADNHRNVAALVELLQALVARTRARPNGSVVAALIEARDDGDRLTEPELTSMAGLLLTAGYETTANLIGNGVLALLLDPAQLALVRAEPDRLPAVIEEMLRYCGPVYLGTPRFTLADVPCGALTIPARELVYVSLLAADHDPARFDAPAAFDAERPAQGHLAFGHGIHFCLGAPLARLEAEIALRSLLSRFADITLAVDPDTLHWRASTVVHALDRLPVRLGPGKP